MLKDILLTTLAEVNRLEAHNSQVMKECIDKKLDRSLNYYESNLEKTCKYILAKNPISVIKAMTVEIKKPKSEEEDDELRYY